MLEVGQTLRVAGRKDGYPEVYFDLREELSHGGALRAEFVLRGSSLDRFILSGREEQTAMLHQIQYELQRLVNKAADDEGLQNYRWMNIIRGTYTIERIVGRVTPHYN